MQESIVFIVHVQCRRKESSRTLSHFLMSFFVITVLTPALYMEAYVIYVRILIMSFSLGLLFLGLHPEMKLAEDGPARPCLPRDFPTGLGLIFFANCNGPGRRSPKLF